VRGRDERAARLYGAAERQGQQHDIDLGAALWQRYYAPHLATARARLGEVAWEAGLADGRSLSLDDVVAEALAPDA
jgi:hypothetical protein